MKLIKSLLFAALATLGAASSASVVITTDMSATDTIPGLSESVTTGAKMHGLRVTALFSNGFTETLSWAGTGDESGGVTGQGWGLSLDGNSYNQNWLFSIGTGLGQLLSFKLDASGPDQVTVFDNAFGGEFGTASSTAGTDFELTDCPTCTATAAYSNAVALAGDAAVGDIFHTLLVSFNGGTGPSADFSFLQDTDSDSRLVDAVVPEPGSVALIGLAMLGMGAALRRRK